MQSIFAGFSARQHVINSASWALREYGSVASIFAARPYCRQNQNHSSSLQKSATMDNSIARIDKTDKFRYTDKAQ
jgi:hypothetical protein